MVLTRKIFEDYLNIEHEIKRINRKLDYYSRHPIASSHGVVRGSMGGFPYAQCHFVVGAPDVKSSNDRHNRVMELMVDLSEKKNMYEDIQFEIDMAIEDIEDLEIKQILQLKYIERWTDEEIGEEIGCERSTVSKKISKFFESQQLSQISHS